MSEPEGREGREEEKEAHIYPDDIQIINNPNQPPGPQIKDYALKIGYDPDLDSEELLEIAEKNLMNLCQKNGEGHLEKIIFV